MERKDAKNCKACRPRRFVRYGYVMLYRKDHHRAQSNGYVYEHIVVMEEMLERRMVPGETVHHLNGVRGDNRPENLELWTRPQPYGIRAVDVRPLRADDV